MEISIEANANSTTGGTGKRVSGLSLKQGDILSIFCKRDDTWQFSSVGGEFIVNANGNNNYAVNIGETQQQFPAAALVGSFDDGKTFFSVGLSTQITILEGGENPKLMLYCADSDRDNNSGSVTAFVKKSN